MANKVTYISVNAIDSRGMLQSESWDEEAFANGDFDWNDVLNEYIGNGCTNIKLEVRTEE